MSTIKQGEEAKRMADLITLENNRKTFKVYDCPIELINKHISYAKLHFDNQVWKVMEKGMNLILEEQSEWRFKVEKRLELLENTVFKEKKEEEESEIPKTFGGRK